MGLGQRRLFASSETWKFLQNFPSFLQFQSQQSSGGCEFFLECPSCQKAVLHFRGLKSALFLCNLWQGILHFSIFFAESNPEKFNRMWKFVFSMSRLLKDSAAFSRACHIKKVTATYFFWICNFKIASHALVLGGFFGARVVLHHIPKAHHFLELKVSHRLHLRMKTFTTADCQKCKRFDLPKCMQVFDLQVGTFPCNPFVESNWKIADQRPKAPRSIKFSSLCWFDAG